MVLPTCLKQSFSVTSVWVCNGLSSHSVSFLTSCPPASWAVPKQRPLSRLLPMHKWGTGGRWPCTDEPSHSNRDHQGGELKGRTASRWDLCMGQPDREGHLPRVLSLTSVHLQRSGYFLRFIWLAISVFITILKRRLYSATSLAGGGDLLVIIPWDQLTFLSFCPCPMLSCCSGRDTPGVSSPWGPLTCFRISPRKWI